RRFGSHRRLAGERFEQQRFRPRQRLHGSTRADPAPDARDRRRPARPSATLSTTPETSCPGIVGSRSDPSQLLYVSAQVNSARVMPVARTRMRASPGLSSGFGASSYTSCTGPPRLCNRLAFIVISPPWVFSSREPSRRKVSARFAVPLSALRAALRQPHYITIHD